MRREGRREKLAIQGLLMVSGSRYPTWSEQVKKGVRAGQQPQRVDTL